MLGWGNGDPGFKDIERPQGADKQHAEFDAFMGNAQFILRGLEKQSSVPVNVTICLNGAPPTTITF